MSSRELPQSVEQVLAAARRIHPAHGLFVTFSPEASGSAWELHPFKRWLVLRTDDFASIREGVACSLLAQTAWLGTGDVTAVPEALLTRLQRLVEMLSDTSEGRSTTGGAMCALEGASHGRR